MSESADRRFSGLDELPGPAKAVAAAGFFALWAVLVFVPLLWGSRFLYQHAYWVGGGLGLLWWPAVQEVGPVWLAKFEARHPRRKAPVADARLLTWVRWRARWYTVRRASAWLVVPTMTAMLVGGHEAAGYDQELIDTQSRVNATIVEVYRPPLSGRGEGPSVTVDLGGRSAELGMSFPEEGEVRPGDQIEVVVDPDDPEYVIAATSHEDWAYTWWGEVVIGGGIALLLGGMWLLWARTTPERAVLRRARRASSVEHVEILESTGDNAVELVAADGRRWRWTGDLEAGAASGPARVVGHLTEGGLPLLETCGRLNWPVAPLAEA